MRKLAALLVLSSLSFVVRADMYEDFIVAVNNDRVPQVKELLGKGIDPNTVGPNGEPALVLAARAGYAGTVDALLAAKANVNARSPVGDSAIMAAALNGHTDLVKKLRARGECVLGIGGLLRQMRHVEAVQPIAEDRVGRPVWLSGDRIGQQRVELRGRDLAVVIDVGALEQLLNERDASASALNVVNHGMPLTER